MILLQEFLKSLNEVLSWFLGNRDEPMCTLIIFMAADLLTGIMSSIADHQFNGSTLLKGIAKKICILILIGIAHTMDLNLLSGAELLRSPVLFFFISSEGISICKNASKLGVTIPDRLKKELIRMIQEDQNDTSKKS